MQACRTPAGCRPRRCRRSSSTACARWCEPTDCSRRGPSGGRPRCWPRLLPDDGLRARVAAECSPTPPDLYDEPVPVPEGWPGATPCGYLSFTYDDDAAEAERHSVDRRPSRGSPPAADGRSRRRRRVAPRAGRRAAVVSRHAALVGVTASGKSALALELARRRPGDSSSSRSTRCRCTAAWTSAPRSRRRPSGPRCRTTSSTSPTRATSSRSRRFQAAAATRSPTSRAGATGPCWSAAPASTSARSSTTSTCPAGTRRSRPSSRPSPTPSALTAGWPSSTRSRRPAWSRPTAAASSGRSR